jgi:hypothetical protein
MRRDELWIERNWQHNSWQVIWQWTMPCPQLQQQSEKHNYYVSGAPGLALHPQTQIDCKNQTNYQMSAAHLLYNME